MSRDDTYTLRTQTNASEEKWKPFLMCQDECAPPRSAQTGALAFFLFKKTMVCRNLEEI